MEIQTSLISVIILFLLLICWKSLVKLYNATLSTIRIRKALRNFPGPKEHWLFGNALELPKPGNEMMEWAQQYTIKYPKYNKFSFLSFLSPEIWLRHPGPIKQILKTSEPKPLSFGGGYNLIEPWLGEGLLLSNGKKWFRNRKLLTPGFHFDVLKPYITIYNEAADKLIKKWQDEGKRGKEGIEIYKHVSLCTLDVMLRCAFSYQSDIQSKENRYVKTVNLIAEMLWYRGLNPLLHFETLFYITRNGRQFKEHVKYAHNVAYDLIKKRMKSLENDNEIKDKKYVDFLDILLLAKDENGNGLTGEEIRQEVDTFLFEGHDTTASAISWILYALAKHPDEQQRCRDEINSLFTEKGTGLIEWGDLQNMPYFTQCIKEALRMYSPVPLISRELTQAMKMDEFTLVPGTKLTLSIFSLHHNPLVWGEDHDEYKPERFSSENIQQMDSHAFIPFSAGPRNCIGQNFAMNEIKVVVARLIRHFDISVVEDHPIEMLPFVVVRPKYGIKLYLKPFY